MIRAGETGHRAELERKDMIVFEQRLVEALGALFSFTSHSMHFPRAREESEARWIAGEKKLLLPLAHADGEPVLGVFMARGVSPKSAAALLPHWPAICSLITDNLLLYKRSLSDPVTGLFTRHYLLRTMERAIETQRTPFAQPQAVTPAVAPGTARRTRKGKKSGPEARIVTGSEEPRMSSLATLVVRLAALRDVVREFGYQFADQLMVALADALLAACPEQALAARTGDSEFAVFLPSAGAKACRTLARDIVQALRQVYLVHPLRREQVGIYASVGYTLYPQDVAGTLFVRPPAEQARLVLRKARLAAALAEETPFKGRADADAVMGFGNILSEGGRVLEALPLSRVLVSLGANMHAREGQRFSVWTMSGPGDDSKTSRPLAPLYKGEVVLMDVHENVSQAEVIHLGEPGWGIEPGDHLVLLPEEQGSLAQDAAGQSKKDAATGLLRHGDFLARWSVERDKADGFALALLRLAPLPGQEACGGPVPSDRENGPNRENSPDWENGPAGGGGLPDAPTGHDAHAHPGRFMAEAVRLCREELGIADNARDSQPGAPAVPLGGRYGLNSLIFFHPDPDLAALTERYTRLVRAIESRLGVEVAVGIAPHPFLDYRKGDALENCQKALEYAMLLPDPHVGVLDSLALNISADKRFSQGDTFGAIKEYQLALLADETNGMAWNSLGICLAGLGRHAEAERHFTRALDCARDDVMALYNLGYMHQSQGNPEPARARYEECLRHDPEHLYALIRLGQLAENAADPDTAREQYDRAARLPGGKGLTYRHFARLCIAEGRRDEAREHLHEALLHDPQDAMAMVLLSRLYLDAGEDPDMAATFARQSVSLRPDLKGGWLELARAMQALGRDKEAGEARLKAGQA